MNIVGDQLLDEYKHQFQKLKQQDHFNRLENIALKKNSRYSK